MNHGLNRFTTYIDINEYSHDSNLIMNTVLKELHESSVLMGSFLPEILYMQADNCFRENKNRFMLAFCELLVRKNIFKEVHLSFLPVDHTHEEIDAAFSKISDKLRKNDAETLTGFMHLLPSCKINGGIYDIRGWLTPHITLYQGRHHLFISSFQLMKLKNSIRVQRSPP
ncbi:unnamed protein product [Mytilus edulis]|uniref:DUF7869 domain-containing protein n=1 Tax=Mytilus edulis TaxID=6550 RepID=A0A8S3V507_MYTED|nr:unnamed protein product [Mytilus edulis]